MKKLVRWFLRREEPASATSVQSAPDEASSAKPRAPLKVNDLLLARAKGIPVAATDSGRMPIFVMPKHPPGVGPEGKTSGFANDSALTEVQSWASASYLGSFWTEGITFLGYPYLSELAQRPEYRIMSETLAGEMTRKWIEFTSGEDEDKTERIAELAAEFERLNVRDIFCRATEQDGFFGRGHIYIDTGDTDDQPELQQAIGDGWDELSKAKMAKKRIKALRTVEAVWCYPTGYNSNDPLKPDWYRPNQWYVQAKIVHASRLLTFISREVPDLLKPTYSFGGLSLSQMAKPYVDNWLQTRQGVNDIINSFVIPVLATNLAESLNAQGDDLFKRAQLFTALRSNQGLMLIDKDSEDFQQVAAPIAGLHELQAQAQEHMASVSHIPTVKLLGIQPAGLNADSEGVIRSFYDYILSFQEHLYRDKIHRLMGLVMLSLWGETDDAIGFKFVPLWSLDEKQEAEVDKIEAETDQILVDIGAIGPDEVRARVAADPTSGYNSIDVEDMPEPPVGENDDFMLDDRDEGAKMADRLFGPQKDEAA